MSTMGDPPADWLFCFRCFSWHHDSLHRMPKFIDWTPPIWAPYIPEQFKMPVPPKPSDKPCMEMPENASCKTIGYTPCSKCTAWNCWRGYLEWEVRTGQKLNEHLHHLVKDDPK